MHPRALWRNLHKTTILDDVGRAVGCLVNIQLDDAPTGFQPQSLAVSGQDLFWILSCSRMYHTDSWLHLVRFLLERHWL